MADIPVVNDTAERTVGFMTKYNLSLTFNEKQKKYLLQVVEDHRKRIQKPTKKNLISYNPR